MRRIALVLLLSLGACMASAPSTSRKFVVFFQEWSVGLDDSARAAIGGAARFARQNPADAVTVTGFATPQGSEQANIDLSRTRAQVVVDELVRGGVPQSRIRLAAAGPTDYTLSSTESRRVEVAVGGP